MEPSAKRRRNELDDGVLVLSKLKGRIALRIDGFSKFLKATRRCRSTYVRIRGFDWTLIASPFSIPNNGLEFYIKCDGSHRGPKWNCAATIILHCISGSKDVEMDRGDDVKFNATSAGVSKVSI